VAIIIPFSARGRLEFEQFDQAYVARLREKDPEVEAHFTAYFGQLVLIKLSRRLRSRADLEDARNETLERVLAAVRAPEGVRQPERFGAFVNSVCNNVYRERCRDRRLLPLPAEAAARPDGAGSLLDALISEEERREVHRVLDELGERDRAVLRAVYLDEADRAAVCRDLQVSSDYLRVVLLRAKKKFRQRAASGARSSGTSGERPPARSS